MVPFIQDIFKEVVQFFIKEKAHTVLLIVSIVTFIACVIMFDPYEEQPSPALEKFQQVERLQKEEGGAEKIMSFVEQDRTLKIISYVFNYIVLGLFISGIAINVKVFFRWKAKKEIIHPLYTPQAAWGLHDVAKFLIVLFSFMVVMSIFTRYIFWLYGVEKPGMGYMVLHGSLIDSMALFFILYYAIWQYKDSFKNIGLQTKAFTRDVGIGFVSYSWLLPIFFFLVVGVSVIAKVINYEPPPHALIDILIVEDKRNPVIVAYSIVLACALGPFVEELFFRGFLYDAIRKRWGATSAIVLTSTLFAYVHESWFSFMPIFFLGVVLAYLREKRGNLIPSITVHVIHNTVLLTYFFIIKRAVIDNL